MTLNRSFLPGKVLILASIIILLGTGCGEKKQIRGKEYVPREDMVELMLEIHLLDGITNDVKYYRKYNPNDSINLYSQIFEDHGYSKVTFDSTLKEYARHPYLLDELYNDVMMKLNLLQDQLNQEEQERADLKKQGLPNNALKTR